MIPGRAIVANSAQQLENTKPASAPMRIARHGVREGPPVNSSDPKNEAVAHVRRMRATDRIRGTVTVGPVYFAACGPRVIGTSTRPGTLTVEGAKRPPAASPPGSGVYSSIAICVVAASGSTTSEGGCDMVSEATASTGTSSATALNGPLGRAAPLYFFTSA